VTSIEPHRNGKSLQPAGHARQIASRPQLCRKSLCSGPRVRLPLRRDRLSGRAQSGGFGAQIARISLAPLGQPLRRFHCGRRRRSAGFRRRTRCLFRIPLGISVSNLNPAVGSIFQDSVD
jgi:hypothetical protein